MINEILSTGLQQNGKVLKVTLFLFFFRTIQYYYFCVIVSSQNIK